MMKLTLGRRRRPMSRLATMKMTTEDRQMNAWPALRGDLHHALLCASDLVRTERGGLSEGIQDAGYSFELYWPCRRVLEFLEVQLGYHVWTHWGDRPNLSRPTAIIYADALLEAAWLIEDHWQEFVDYIRLESDGLRALRDEVRDLTSLVDALAARVGGMPTSEAVKELYMGVFS